MLVPEINLTPQLEARFAARFPGRRLVSLHSALTPAQRLNHWLLAHLGRADLVLGTRLAVFASMPRLGLIVVDEEHDPSFKQQEGARYSARDLAVYRGHLDSVPVLLGSATPSLETWQRTLEGRYRRLTLAQRIGDGVMPRVRLIDTNNLPRRNGVLPPLAAPLLDAVQQRIARGEQSLLLLNRRGYAPVLHCGQCAWKSGCPHCSAWRVFHKSDRTLRCHHCAFTEAVPRACPECGNLDIAPLGRGTEKLEEQLAGLLPGARIARIDADSTRHKGALESQLSAVHEGEVDVLVGTQMVAKGHDFRRMTLVAAINPDGALFSSDFRAAERLFALLMQAAGRAGRNAEQAARSEMWIQTATPTHAAVPGAGETRLRGLRHQSARRASPRRAAALQQPGAGAGRSARRGGGHGLPAGRVCRRIRPARRCGGQCLPAGAASHHARGRHRAHADAGRVGLPPGAAALPGCLAAGPAHDAAPAQGPGALGDRRGPAGDLSAPLPALRQGARRTATRCR